MHYGVSASLHTYLVLFGTHKTGKLLIPIICKSRNPSNRTKTLQRLDMLFSPSARHVSASRTCRFGNVCYTFSTYYVKGNLPTTYPHTSPLYSTRAKMVVPNHIQSNRHPYEDDGITSDSPVDEHVKIIHHQHAPPFDLLTCEILDSILQSATIDQIALLSQLHTDTVRRAVQIIESTLHSSSYSQIIDNCHIRHWNTALRHNPTDESHTFG